MANTILHKRSSTSGTIPSTGSLSQGELGINIADGRIYTKNNYNNIINLGVTSISGTSITPSSGNFSNYLAVNSVPVSLSGHSHTTVQQAESLVTTVFNETGSQLSKMTAVYINGGHGDLPTVQKAIATSDATSAGTYGLIYTAINNMESGQIIVFGSLSGVNTDPAHGGIAGATEGSVLYLSPTVSGALTTTKPYAPDHVVAIGTVVRVHQNEGVIEVRVQNGFELDELHNVAITGATNGQFLQYNSTNGLWVPSSSGNFSSLSVNNTGVSLSGHNHNGVYADIATGDPQTQSNSIVDRAYALYDLPNDWAALWIEDAAVYAADNAIFDSFKINMGLDSAVTGIGIVNHIPYWNSINGMVADSGQLVWDSTNNRLGIGNSSPSVALDIRGDVRISGVSNTILSMYDNGAASYKNITMQGNNFDVASSHIVAGFSVGVRGNRGTNVGMESAGSNSYLALAAGGSEKVRIATDGKVGIGTTTPSGQLHVVGTGIFTGVDINNSAIAGQGALTVNGGIVTQGSFVRSSTFGIYGDNNTRIYKADVSTLNYSVSSSGYKHSLGYDVTGNHTSWMVVNNTGVGIGTQTPTSKLHVAGDVLATGSFIAGSGSAANPSFEFVGDTDTGMFAPVANTIGLATSGVERLRINNAGNVGINYSTPTTTLQVNGSFSCGSSSDPSAGGQGLYVDPATPLLRFNDSGPNTVADIDANGLTLYDIASSPFFYTDRTNSRIGIGTDSPNANLAISAGGAGGTISGAAQSQPFQINDATASDYINLAHFNITNSSSRGSFTLSNNSSSAWENNVMQFFVHGSTYAHGYYGGNTSDAGCAMIVTQGSEITKLQIGNYNSAPIEFFTDNTFRAIIDTAGNVGIGTANPSAKLDVTGDVNIDGNLTFDSFTESVVDIGNSSTTQTIDLTSGTVQTCTLTGNCTFTMPTATAGKSFSLFLNTGTGGYSATFTGVRWSDSTPPTITSTANKVDLLSFISDGTYWYGSFSQNYG